MKEIKAEFTLEVTEDPEDVKKFNRWHRNNTRWGGVLALSVVTWLLSIAFDILMLFALSTVGIFVSLIILIIRLTWPPKEDGINYMPTSYGAC